MQKNVTQKVQEFIEPIVNKLGYDIVEVEFGKKQNGMNLTVYIDKKGGVSLDDCVAVHEAIDAPLDELDPTSGEGYILNVSSPGLDRPIKTDADLNRNLGEILEATTFVKIGAKKNFVGKLEKFDDESITLMGEDKTYELKREQIAKLCKYIEF
ncbi:MAG: ribosome maturation factor RimP [Clostridia bacterium]|nr:ribosome maturation factor RimP [Clostridia bacterium]